MTESPQAITEDIPSVQPAQTLDYANPSTLHGDVEIVRKRGLLITPTRVVLPPLCVKTGSSDDLVEKQWNLVWYPPLILLGLLLPGGILVVLVLYLLMKKKGDLRFHVQRQFVARRRNWVLGGLCVFIGGAALSYWFLQEENYNFVAIGMGVILTSFVIMIAGGRILYPSRINKNEMHLRGCGEPFLAQFEAVR